MVDIRRSGMFGGGIRKALLRKIRFLQILFVKDQDAENSTIIIYVWDGTDASPVYSNPL